MDEITAITPQIKDKTRCNVYLDGRFCCGLKLETAVKNRLKVGMTVSAETLAKIQLESEKATALDKAMTHLSATRKTEKQIRDFLSKKGYLPAVCDYVVEKLCGYGFLNDAEYAEAYVDAAAKKKGGRLLRMELKGKGLSETDIDAALERMDAHAQEEGAREILRKYMRGKTADKPTLQKAAKYLLGKGFDYELIRTLLRDFEEFDEE